MLTKQKNYKISYASRILALSIIAFLIFAFTVKTKTPANLPLKDNFTVVIDAGHGGNTGAHVGDVYEDELVLQLAKAVKAENRNNKINIVFTRETKHNMDLKERVNIAQQKNADLFISLHMNFFDKTADSQQKGIEVLVPKQNLHRAKSQLLGSALLASLKDVYRSYKYASIGETNAFIVNQNICPAVMLECGYISNENDRAFMTQPSNQKLIARQILAAVERYAASNELSTQPVMVDTAAPITVKGVYIPNVSLKDTANPVVFLDGVKKGRLKELGGLDKLVPANEIKAMYVYKGKEAIQKFGKSGENGVIQLFTKIATPPPAPGKEVTIKAAGTGNPLVIIDGVESGLLNEGKMEKLNGNEIAVVNVLKGEAATGIYGDKGKQGVIEVTTKAKQSTKEKNEAEQKNATEQGQLRQEQEKKYEEQQKKLTEKQAKETGK